MYHFLCRCSLLQALSPDRTDYFGHILVWNTCLLQVVDVTALRQYKVPGTVESCDVLESLLKMFTEPNRPKTRRTWKQGRRKRTVCSTVPLVSERILGNIFDYVGHLTTEDGEAVLLGNTPEHFDTCVLHRPDLAAAKRWCSYGWHNEQLTAAEYVATISREISANLDFMAEARRWPRPAWCFASNCHRWERRCGSTRWIRECRGCGWHSRSRCRRCGSRHVSSTGHSIQTDLACGIQWFIRHGASQERGLRSGKCQHQTFRRILASIWWKIFGYERIPSLRTGSWHGCAEACYFQRRCWLEGAEVFTRISKEKDEKLMDASEDEFLPGNASLLEVPVGMAPETEVLVLSPADMALRLLQQRLPTRQADGTYQISPDQYKACVLAIAPLQKLWVKAGEHDLQHCFGTRGRLRELLALVTPVLG